LQLPQKATQQDTIVPPSKAKGEPNAQKKAPINPQIHFPKHPMIIAKTKKSGNKRTIHIVPRNTLRKGDKKQSQIMFLTILTIHPNGAS
jgi:hypothetical protein